MATKEYEIVIDFDYADPSPDAALEWMTTNYFSKAPGFIEATVVSSNESSDQTVEDDLENTIRAYFNVTAESKDAALADLSKTLIAIDGGSIGRATALSSIPDTCVWEVYINEAA
jgi:hypothetical protein